MGSNRSPPALGTWAAPTRRAKISPTARTVPFARSGRESRAAIEGIEDDGIVRRGHASQADSLEKRRHEPMFDLNAVNRESRMPRWRRCENGRQQRSAVRASEIEQTTPLLCS